MLDLDKPEEAEIKLSTSIESKKKQNNSRKISTFASLTMLKPLTMWITKKNVENSSRDRIIRLPYKPHVKMCMQVKKQHLEQDTEQ